MLTAQMKTLIRSFSAGSVATVTPEGLPRVSPKATFVILDHQTLAFGNIRSPGTLANLRANPAVEVCFTDILHRRALRVTGRAEILRKGDADSDLRAAFDAAWADYVPHMSAFVRITLSAAEIITSPAYDIGLEEGELKSVNLAKLNAL
jgi:general stress protein 26